MSKKNETEENFIKTAIWCFVITGLLTYFWPHLIAPFRFFEFWDSKGSLWEAVKNAWPMYLWGISTTVLLAIFRGSAQQSPTEILLMGLIISALAGFFEEVVFRWLLFLSAIIMIPIGDWLLLGFMGLHLLQWLYVVVLCPIANFFTLGYLESYLLGGYGWPVAAAVISSNGRFRDQHKYLGLIGYINSWFGGIYFFWVMFTYGIVAAIIIHFLYDLFIFTVIAILATLTRR